MPNDESTPTDAPSPIEVLFADDLADDDHVWVVRCTVDELHRMFENPVAWVAGLADLDGWTKLGTSDKASAPLLTPDFAMVAERTEAEDPLNRVLVQGISGSNALTIVAAKGAATLSAQRATGDLDDPLAAFWKAVESDPDNQPSGKKPYPVLVLESLGRWYGHFEVRDPVMEPAPLAVRTATFLLATLFDPEGYAAMLNRLDQKPIRVKCGAPAGNDPIAIVPPATAPTSTFYANAQVSNSSAKAAAGPEDDPTPPPPDPFVCVLQDGAYSDGSGSNDGGTIKRYIDDDPTPTPPTKPHP